MDRKLFWFTVLMLAAVAGYALWSAATPRAYSAPRVLSEQEAVAAAHRFLEICGLAPPSGQLLSRLHTKKDGWQEWELDWPQYTFSIEAQSGVVYWFRNYAREYEQAKGIGRNRPPRFTSREMAEQHCWQLARRLGLPKDARLTGLRMTKEGEAGDANRAGAISACFAVRPFGYTFVGGGCEVSLTVDPLDGVLVGFRRAVPYFIESHDLRISKEEAVRGAKQVYEGWYRTHRSPHRGQYAGRVEVGYIFPNGSFGAKRYPPRVPHRVRLAYAVYFGNEAVWIDAADGSLLGGVLLK